jgi:hypothetical protein
MRRASWLAGGLLLLGAFSEARAQVPWFFGGTPTSPLVTDTAKIIAPMPVQTRPTGFKLIDFFPRITFNLGKPVTASQTYPDSLSLMRAINYTSPTWTPPPPPKP